jgi:hypothetical protein
MTLPITTEQAVPDDWRPPELTGRHAQGEPRDREGDRP